MRLSLSQLLLLAVACLQLMSIVTLDIINPLFAIIELIQLRRREAKEFLAERQRFE
jgi:hypothetical protein